MITPETYLAGNAVAWFANTEPKTSKNTDFSLLQLGALRPARAGRWLQPGDQRSRIIYYAYFDKNVICDSL